MYIIYQVINHHPKGKKEVDGCVENLCQYIHEIKLNMIFMDDDKDLEVGSEGNTKEIQSGKVDGSEVPMAENMAFVVTQHSKHLCSQ